MAAAEDDFGRRLVTLIDAGNGALGRHDRRAAVVSYARASELLFQQAARTDQYDANLQLVRRARQLLDELHSLS